MESWVSEIMEELVQIYQKKKKSKRGFYNAWTKKEMAVWINEAADKMETAVSQQRYEDDEL